MNRFVFSEGAVTLNDEQARIVRSPPKQNLRILASAGSGKTTTLTARIAHLLTHEGALPSEIILLTFTHNAAAIMRQRLEGLVGSKRILCGTFHALSQQILRDQAPELLQDLYHVDELPLKALDFLATAKGGGWIRTLKWLFIDEFQDINDIQYKFIRALHHEGTTITIVGDDAQNIYTWRGSCVDYILNFHQRFADLADFQLATNYRSTAAIVAVANSTMRYIPTLDHKELMSASHSAEQGERPAVHYFARTSEERDWVCEAAIKATGSTVILSKFNSVLFGYEAALLKLGARVRFVEGEESLSTSGPRTIFLSTFHGSKGLEWDNVFLVRMNDEVFPQQKDEDGILQERRLFYVAVTRARRMLSLTYSRHSKSLSRFVREIHRPLLQWKGLPHFELSNLSSQITPTSVSDWLSILSGEDFRVIKHLNLLPTALKDLLTGAKERESPWTLPYWWVEQGLGSEFFDFLRAFWHHEVGLARPESGGLYDREAHRLIWTIKIAAEDATFFELHRDLFEELADRFFGSTEPGSAPPQIYYTEVIAAIPATHLKGLEQTDLIRLIQIIHKMRTVLYNLRFAHVRLSDLRFAAIRHSPPQEARCELIQAWRSYTDRRPSTLEMADLNVVYRIGLCRSLSEGRSGVLTAMPGEREWSRCRPFLTDFRTKIAAILEGAKTQSILSRVRIEIVPGVTADVDMIVGRVAWFFVAGDQAAEMQRLDRLLGMLLTVHGLRLHGYPVDEICLYQMITGFELRISVADWKPSASHLLTAFVQARASHGS